MIIAIRIAGQPDLDEKIKQSLYRLRLRRKYSAVLLEPIPQNLKLLKSLRNFVAYGDITKETLLMLIEKRAKSISDKRVNAKEVVENLDKKSLASQDLKPFFRLHPPRKGIESKKHFGVGKGVLGDNKDKINELIRRML